MNEYNPDHFRFVRQSGLHRDTFQSRPSPFQGLAAVLGLLAVVVIAGALTVAGLMLLGVW